MTGKSTDARNIAGLAGIFLLSAVYLFFAAHANTDLTAGRFVLFMDERLTFDGVRAVLHPHGLNMSGRWVGLGYDGRIMSGWASMGQTREESETTMASLISSEGVAYVND